MKLSECLRLTLLAISAACFAANAFAAEQPKVLSKGQLNVRQVPAMRIVGSQNESLPSEIVGSAQQYIARCVYVRRKSDVDDMLSESTPFSIAALKLPAEKRVNEFGLNDCWQSTELSRRGALIIKPETFRAMMAEAVYQAKYASFSNSTAALRTLDHRSFAIGTDDRTFIDLADCVVTANAAVADSLLRTMPGSDAERAAANAMASTIKGCTENAEIEVLVPTIRGLAAYGLWMRYVRAES